MYTGCTLTVGDQGASRQHRDRDVLLPIISYVDHPTAWHDGVANYNGITTSKSKVIFSRLPFGIWCKSESSRDAGDKARHDLACLLELRHKSKQGQQALAEKSEQYRVIARLPTVVSAENCASSALATFLQDSESTAAMGPVLPRLRSLATMFN